MSYSSDYSDNYDDDSCHSNDNHFVGSYGTSSSSHGSYDDAPEKIYCPCQPIQIKIFNQENIYIDKGSYNGEIEDYNFDNASTSCDHNRSDRQDNGDANSDRDDKSLIGDSRDQIKDKSMKEEMNENSKNDAKNKISPKRNTITLFRGTPISMPVPKIGITYLSTHQSNRDRTSESDET